MKTNTLPGDVAGRPLEMEQRLDALAQAVSTLQDTSAVLHTRLESRVLRPATPSAEVTKDCEKTTQTALGGKLYSIEIRIREVTSLLDDTLNRLEI